MGRILRRPRNAKSIVLDIISLASSQARVFVLVMALVVLAIVPTTGLVYCPFKSINKHMLPVLFNDNCPDDGVFKDCCPSCGLTRGFSSVLHGHLHQAYEYNVLVFVVFGLVLALIYLNSAKVVREHKRTGRWY
ncbi:DUF2752 domain-containing protein [Candidatus Woesearchaeota archaeon]|nr:DUF2752 domain-containing protein [Candidatus Woesearchaeota archaeon]